MPSIELLLKGIFSALIHSLWIGSVVMFVAALCLLFFRKYTSAFRYNILCVLLIAFIFFELVCFYSVLRSESTPTLSTLPGRESNNLLASCLTFLEAYSLPLVCVWFTGFSFKCLQLFLSLLGIHELKRSAQGIETSWDVKLKALALSIGFRRAIRLLVSEQISVPTVAGILKPIILLPAGLITQLPPQQIEAILIHEIAHLKRFDFVTNLGQSFLEALFFFNPPILWVSSKIRQLREDCCDDMVLRLIPDKRAYLHGLAFFQRAEIGHKNAVEVNFASSQFLLLRRFKRIWNGSDHYVLNSFEKVSVLISGIVCLFPAIFLFYTNPEIERHHREKTATRIIVNRSAPITTVNNKTAMNISISEPTVKKKTMFRTKRKKKPVSLKAADKNEFPDIRFKVVGDVPKGIILNINGVQVKPEEVDRLRIPQGKLASAIDTSSND